MAGIGSDRFVIITGASTGIGRACALHLDKLGFQVIAGVRKKSDGEDLKGFASSSLRWVILDIADDQSRQHALEELSPLLENQGLFGLVNNAGIVISGPLEFIPIPQLRMQFEVNVIGQIAVTQDYLKFIRKSPGRIINISSINGRISAPFLGPYSASKFALTSLTDALRMELSQWNIPVVLVEPGRIATPIWVKSENLADRLVEKLPDVAKNYYGATISTMKSYVRKAEKTSIPSQEVAKIVAHALTVSKPHTKYLVGKDAKALAIANKLVPDSLMDRFILRGLKG